MFLFLIEQVVVMRAKQPKTVKIRGRNRRNLLKLRHSHLSCKVIENKDLAAKGKVGLKGRRLVAADAPVPNVVID